MSPAVPPTASHGLWLLEGFLVNASYWSVDENSLDQAACKVRYSEIRCA